MFTQKSQQKDSQEVDWAEVNRARAENNLPERSAEDIAAQLREELRELRRARQTAGAA